MLHDVVTNYVKHHGWLGTLWCWEISKKRQLSLISSLFHKWSYVTDHSQQQYGNSIILELWFVAAVPSKVLGSTWGQMENEFKCLVGRGGTMVVILLKSLWTNIIPSQSYCCYYVWIRLLLLGDDWFRREFNKEIILNVHGRCYGNHATRRCSKTRISPLPTRHSNLFSLIWLQGPLSLWDVLITWILRRWSAKYGINF